MTQSGPDAAYPPTASTVIVDPRRNTLRERTQRTGQWSSAQTAGRRWAMDRVALEITQRCNLDCALCYLSDSAEAMRYVPL